jgi:hypothetical protein
MEPWWTRCPICNGETRPGKLPLAVRFQQWILRHPILWGVDWPILRMTSFSRICPTHGPLTLPTLRHGPHHCQACGYDLRATEGHCCPECGWEIPLPLRRELTSALKNAGT